VRHGIIIYAAGEAPPDWSEEKEAVVKQMVSEADGVEIITSRTGHFDVMDAWYSLLLKSINHIVCRMAGFSTSGELVFTGRSLRLSG
jgi:hypothetical protein